MVFGCQSADLKMKMQEDYKQSISFFHDSLISHFPSNLPDSSGYQTNVLQVYDLAKFCFDVCETKLWKDYKDKEYNILKDNYDSLAKAIYLKSDTSLTLLFPYCNRVEVEGRVFEKQETLDRQKLAKHNLTMASSLPVPLFEIDEYKGNTLFGLTDDFKLYVLDAKPGKYLADKYLEVCECLPKKWEHGYSKGVALSDRRKVVIYWISVW
jgi:hypothetical protein